MRISLLDYGVGNLHSLARALETGGVSVSIDESAAVALAADAIVLPGVGAFGAAAERLAPYREDLRGALLDGLPCLGICLGMQLLFDSSEEGGGDGIGIIPGRVRALRGARVPHMGWNVVTATDHPADPLLREVGSPAVYYANSFVAEPADPGCVTAWTRYGDERFPAVVRAGATRGVQFHPEKSGAAGLRIIQNFLDEAER